MRIRVVWHYRASDETRTFAIRYRVTGVTVAYDDVVDVNWKVWGERVGSHAPAGSTPGTASIRARPHPAEIHVFGHPANVDGSVTSPVTT